MTDTSQAATFRKLKQIPWDEMEAILVRLSSTQPFYNFGNNVAFETRKHELVRYYERIKCLEKHGWTLEEFVLTAEKRFIMAAVDDYNKNNTFPIELVDRAKEFFPNAEFIQAKIILE